MSAASWRAAAVGLPVALALALTLYKLSSRSLWLDEGASLSIAAQHGTALWHAIAHDGGNMLAYYLGLHVVVAAFGDGIVLARALSAVCAAGAVAAVSWIALRQVGPRSALAAGVLTAVSLPLVFWGQDIRGYAPMIMLVTVSYAALVVLLDPRPSARSPRLTWLIWFLATGLAVYCSFAAALVVPAQALGLLGRRRATLRAALASGGALVVACAPLIVLAAARGTTQLFWVGPVTLHEFAQALRWLTSSGLQPNFYLHWPDVPLMVVTLVALAAAAVWLLVERDATAARERWTAWLAAGWLVVPLALEAAESLAGQPVLLTRNSLVSLPAVGLMLGCALGHPRVPRALAAGVVAVIVALRAAVLVPTYGRSPEDWRAASAHVLNDARAGDCIAFYPQDGRMPFDVYVRRARLPAPPRPILPPLRWSAVRPYVEAYRAPAGARLRAAVAGCPRLWLVVSHAGQRHGPPGSRRNYARYVRLRSELGRRYGAASKRSFGWAASVDVTLFTAAGRSPRR